MKEASLKRSCFMVCPRLFVFPVDLLNTNGQHVSVMHLNEKGRPHLYGVNLAPWTVSEDVEREGTPDTLTNIRVFFHSQSPHKNRTKT